MNYTDLYKIAQNYKLPAYVQDASPDIAENTQLDISAYADPVNRKYALHTKAACILSAATALEQEAEPRRSRIMGKLKQAAAGFDALADYEEIVNIGATRGLPVKAANYAFSLHGQDYLPLDNLSQLKAAEAWLFAYRPTLTLKAASAIADKICERSDALNIKLARHADLEQVAGHGVAAGSQLKEALLARRRLLPADHREEREALVKAAAAIPENQTLQPEQSAAFIEQLDKIDHAYGLNKKYGRELNSPESVLVGVSLIKEASERACVTAGGDVFNVDDFVGLNFDKLAVAFDDKFVEGVVEDGQINTQKLAQAVSNLDKLDSYEFSKIAAASGIKPVSRMPLS